jgi:hypothetical protein
MSQVTISLRHPFWRDRSAKGTGNGRSVLAPEQAVAIYHAVGPLAEIGAAFGVSKWTVRDIKAGRTWGWLTGTSRALGPVANVPGV